MTKLQSAEIYYNMLIRSDKWTNHCKEKLYAFKFRKYMAYLILNPCFYRSSGQLFG
jgi:hypothetical protein